MECPIDVKLKSVVKKRLKRNVLDPSTPLRFAQGDSRERASLRACRRGTIVRPWSPESGIWQEALQAWSVGGADDQRTVVKTLYLAVFLAPQVALVSLHTDYFSGAGLAEPRGGSLVGFEFGHCYLSSLGSFGRLFLFYGDFFRHGG